MVQIQFNKFCNDISENNKYFNNIEKEELVLVFFINNVYYILTKLTDFDILSSNDDQHDSFDKFCHAKIDSYVNLLFRKYLDEFSKVIQAVYVKNEGFAVDNDTTMRINNNRINFENLEASVIIDRGNLDKVNKQELKTVAINFNNKYKEVIEKARKDISLSIKDTDNARLIIKKFLMELVNK